MVNGPTENPYAAPQVPVSPELDDVLEADERIMFSGVVNRMDLRQALRPRLSWPFVALFMIGAMTCCVLAGPGFLMPWRKQVFFRSVTDDVLGVMGLGLFILAVTYVASAVFGINWREKRVLAKSPRAYDSAKCGYISAECIYLKESDGEAWLSWNSVGHYQLGNQILIVDWGNGASGGTIFSKDMFSSASEFERVHRVFKKQVDPERSQHRLREMPDYFSTAEILARHPSPEECIAESSKELSHGEAFRYVLAQIPRVLAFNCWPLHAYMALMLVVSMVFAVHYQPCMLLVLIAWAGILFLAMCISVIQHRHLFFRGRERLIKSRLTFTPQEVHCQMTGTYGILRVDRIVVTEATEDKIDFHVEDKTVSSSLERKSFNSEEQWLAVRKLLA